MNKDNKEKNEIKEIEVNTTATPDIDSQKDMGNVSTVKEKKYKNTFRNMLNFIERHNAAITLLFSLMLIVVSVAQYSTYNRQANIASNANKLSQYEYRFEFYQKLESVQQTTATVMLNPKLDHEEFSELSFKILSLLRESKLLFNKDLSQNINNILSEHIEFLSYLNNEDIDKIDDDDYKNEMFKLNTNYTDFLNSDSFIEYLNINIIE
ncbi:hypothetical protein C161_26880 [Paenibacillus sp. FSL R5-192]|uniref:hypothetical protein n=1 Tax=Paenibacillus sp. FSL R5-192 TaxID=1226754 RepID=UPI0003E1C64B|nr:hypothetical protein [Paenibacillus sp. FSL R5-192]ETT31659.1 hypothetical protein C161_26880 [Paenibacillus sp. FSL R5-192]